jgi:hypothetical protein
MGFNAAKAELLEYARKQVTLPYFIFPFRSCF